jgi:hypothetical protein
LLVKIISNVDIDYFFVNISRSNVVLNRLSQIFNSLYVELDGIQPMLLHQSFNIIKVFDNFLALTLEPLLGYVSIEVPIEIQAHHGIKH